MHHQYKTKTLSLFLSARWRRHAAAHKHLYSPSYATCLKPSCTTLPNFDIRSADDLSHPDQASKKKTPVEEHHAGLAESGNSPVSQYFPKHPGLRQCTEQDLAATLSEQRTRSFTSWSQPIVLAHRGRSVRSKPTYDLVSALKQSTPYDVPNLHKVSAWRYCTTVVCRF